VHFAPTPVVGSTFFIVYDIPEFHKFTNGGQTGRHQSNESCRLGACLLSRFGGRRWVTFSVRDRFVARGSVETVSGVENRVNVAPRPEYIP
jgi:hypothetical protein